MEIKDFIKEALSGIVDGIIESQEVLASKKVTICPKYGLSGNRMIVDNVKFEISLAVTDNTQTNGGASLKIAQINKGTSSSNESIQRVTFELPVLFPSGDDLNQNRK